MANSGSINFNDAASKMSSQIQGFEQALETSMQNMDPSNLGEMILFQQELNKLTMLYSVQSSTVKAIKDTAQGIIQKIN